MPGAPSTSATSAVRARAANTLVSLATARAPRTSLAIPVGAAKRSACRTTSGASSSSSAIQDDEERETDRLGQDRLRLGLRPAAGGCDRVDGGRRERSFAAAPARAQDVEADTAGHRRQPPGQVPDSAQVGLVGPQPGPLHGVVERTKHPIGDPPQMVAVGLEPGRQIVVSDRGVTFSVRRTSWGATNRPSRNRRKRRHP